ncbi:type II secretion system F family protein [Amycolatopsis jiangsuensis]|uniref:Pilus assembly protein TadC n=1 Tax=Amycolatopsis jiangsuensis TaxID=1181879 RepID=A0A840J2U1_9PSEU|nr:type II secretion system F family protein [Amycolatopsis jiangsuensis]MBB4687742.1 pilus assembly protein TadC [Amycolatopsis jiangsuensis]
MTTTGALFVLVAVALVLWPGVPPPRHLASSRWKWPTVRPSVVHSVAAAVGGLSIAVVAGIPVGLVAGAGAWWLLRRSRRARPPDDVAGRLRSAAVLDLLTACLRTGMPIPVALETVANGAPADTGKALRSTASLLALGAEPVSAWVPVRNCSGFEELAVAAARTARSGTALAATADELARRLRDGLDTEAEERAERAGVALALPVGLCFLPAFFALGVLPVVLGLAGRIGGLL